MSESISHGDVDASYTAAALRVTQLNTSELDSALLLRIKQSLNEDFFKYIQLGAFQHYHVEIYTALKCVLWYHTFGKTGQTIGQSLLDWKYSSSGKLLRLLHGLIYCFNTWIEERLPRLIKVIASKMVIRGDDDTENAALHLQISQRVDRLMSGVEIAVRSISLLNYVEFIYSGQYLHTWQRLLGVCGIHTKQQFMRATTDPATQTVHARDELWQAYFALFKLADNVLHVKKTMSRVTKWVANRLHSNVNPIDEVVDVTVCAICDQEPTMPHCAVTTEGDTCPHAFCYFCIKSSIIENESTTCPRCLRKINQIEMYFQKTTVF